MTVIYLKMKSKTATDLDAIDKVLGTTFVRLAQQYGAYAVATVAFRYILTAIVKAHEKHQPTEDAWLKELARRFKRALRGKLSGD